MSEKIIVSGQNGFVGVAGASYQVKGSKYVRLARTISRRIEKGVYPPGTLIPSEKQLSLAFGMSRPTVVRALDLLKRDGWLEARQGVGTIVRGRPEATDRRDQHGRIALERDESHGPGYLVGVQFVRSPQRIADLLGVPRNTVVLMRRFLVEEDGEPIELASSYFTQEAIAGTQLASPDLLGGSVRSHMEAHKKVQYDNVMERVSTRPASDDESELLGLTEQEWLLSVLATAHDAAGQVLQVIEVSIPPDRQVLEVYRLT